MVFKWFKIITIETTYNEVIIFLALIQIFDKQLMISWVCLDVNHDLTGLCMTKTVDCIDTKSTDKRSPSLTIFIFSLLFSLPDGYLSCKCFFPLPNFPNIALLPHVSIYSWHWEINHPHEAPLRWFSLQINTQKN